MSDSTENAFDVRTFDVAKFDSILARGLSKGIGNRDGKMCIEAAICTVLNLPHSDDPLCVAFSVRRFKIRLNDARWSSDQARAEGLRDLGLAQLGSKGVVDDHEFAKRMAEKTIRVIIPKLFRALANGRQDWLDAADRCEKEGSVDSARAARKIAVYAVAADAADAPAYYDAYAVAAAAAAYAADAVAAAADAADAAAYNDAAAAAAAADATKSDSYLVLAANLALETLRELNSPGVALLEPQ